MAWFKVDDGFWSHPKTLALSNDAIALWLRSGTWSCQQLTDGFIADHALAMFGIGSHAVAELVEVGYWESDEESGGYSFHDWDEYQEASEKVKGRRDAARERMKAVRANNERTKAERSQPVRDSFAGSSPNPDPTRPDPTRPTYTDQKLVQKPAHDYASEFAEWWATYPRKQGKSDALKAFTVIRKKVPLKTLMEGAQAYSLLNIGEEKSYLKLPAGWLRGERWEDEQIVNATKTTTTNQRAECELHPGYPKGDWMNPCDRCKRDQKEARDRQEGREF